ncbi:protein Arv1p [[Candida] anglica]
MICVECGHPGIEALYSKYKSDYIRLSICNQCGMVADKYIEFDNVILFLDILLLKPQAYRHLCYNEIESELIQGYKQYPTTSRDSRSKLTKFWRTLASYKKIVRLMVMTILFEVYLIWAYEEKKIDRIPTMDVILNLDVSGQYLYFILRSVSEQICFHTCLQYIFQRCFGWGHITSPNIPKASQWGYNVAVLLVVVLVSNSVKLFPILMLIWPYDNSTNFALFINIVGFFNTVEALRVITKCRYIGIVFAIVISTLISRLVSKALLGISISYVSELSLGQILQTDYLEMISNFHEYELFVQQLWSSVFETIE